MKKLILIVAFAIVNVFTGFSQIPENAVDISPLLISEKIPEIEVTSIDGATISISDIVKKETFNNGFLSWRMVSVLQ